MPATFRLILGVLCALVGADAANAQTDFYRAPQSEAAGAPGTLVRHEVIDGAPLGATTYRVLYRSTGLDNKPILVSGVVIVPPGDPPPGGRPIVAWAHPTSGVVPRCAPSLAIFLFEQIEGLRSFVRDGYVVAATDYPGLTAVVEDVPFDLRHLRVIIYDIREPEWAPRLRKSIADYLRNAMKEPEKSIPHPFRFLEEVEQERRSVTSENFWGRLSRSGLAV
jgi:hypothetical protein